MIRTSLLLPEPVHQQVHITAKQEGKNFSEAVRDLITAALKVKQRSQAKRIYAVMRKMEGICTDPITDASATIDEVLYGEHGAWKGKSE
jgi:hypothetical protein